MGKAQIVQIPWKQKIILTEVCFLLEHRFFGLKLKKKNLKNNPEKERKKKENYLCNTNLLLRTFSHLHNANESLLH